MLKHLLIAAATIIPTLAHANMPPKEFDHAYSGKLTEHKVAFGKADDLCRKIAAKRGDHEFGYSKYGCAFPSKDFKTCEIVVSYDPSGADKKMFSNVFRHERAHCNRWPSDHPNALP